jgi:hypothetical protein
MCFKQIAKELHIELVVLDDQDGFCHPAPPLPAIRTLKAKPQKPLSPSKSEIKLASDSL